MKDVEVILLDSNGQEINRTKTDENGSYIFEDSRSRRLPSQIHNSGWLYGYSPKRWRMTDTKDSDPDSDGTCERND